jgi:hypothetical protein
MLYTDKNEWGSRAKLCLCDAVDIGKLTYCKSYKIRCRNYYV